MLKEEFEKRLNVKITKTLFNELNAIYEAGHYNNNTEFTDAITEDPISNALLKECNLCGKELRQIVDDDKKIGLELLALANEIGNKDATLSREDINNQLLHCVSKLMEFADVINFKLKHRMPLTSAECDWIVGQILWF